MQEVELDKGLLVYEGTTRVISADIQTSIPQLEPIDEVWDTIVEYTTLVGRHSWSLLSRTFFQG